MLFPSVTLKRNLSISGEDGTYGWWQHPSGFGCWMLERPKTGDHPCVCVGVYHFKLRFSSAHKDKDYGFGPGMLYGYNIEPGVLVANGRTDLELHSANWFFQLLGCMAPGDSVAVMPAPNYGPMRGVTNSVEMVKAIMKDLDGAEFYLTILEE